MKILHTSDWHLGKKLEGLKRIEEQKKFIDTLEMIVREEEPKVILIAGDIFDTPNPSSEAESLFFDSFKKLSGSGKRAIVIIPRYHDSPERLSACKNLASDFGVIIYEKPFEKKEKPKVEVAITKEVKVEQEKKIENVEPDQEKVARILEVTKGLIENMGLNLEVEFSGTVGKNYVINISGEDKGIIIGKKGKTLNSFEYLLNSLIKDIRIDVDVEWFKEKRNDTLIELANKMAIKAIKTKKVIRLNPMPPRERKIIHEIINQYPELDTFSEGRDPKRYIVIKRKK